MVNVLLLLSFLQGQQRLDRKSTNPSSEVIWTGVCQFMWEHSTEGNKIAMNKKTDRSRDHLFFLSPNVFLAKITIHSLTFKYINLEICGLVLSLGNENETCLRGIFVPYSPSICLFLFSACLPLQLIFFVDNVLKMKKHSL